MPPPLLIYPPQVKKLIRRLSSPRKVQAWLKTLQYNKTETMRTLESVAHFRSAHCLEAALSAAAILEQHGPVQHRSGATGAGYPPLILDLESTDGIDHTLFLYKQNGKFGAVGKSRDIGLDGRKPVFKTVRALVQSYIIPYIDHKACITAYGVLDLRTLKSQRWKTSRHNVWYIENALRKMPHQKILLSKKVLRHWRAKYVAYKKMNSTKQSRRLAKGESRDPERIRASGPDYFPGKQFWQ